MLKYFTMSGDSDFPAGIGSDLLHLMAQSKVATDIQKALYGAGVDSVEGFAALVNTSDAMRAVLKKDFSIDEEASLQDRVKVSKVLVAWEAAKVRTSKIRELEGEAEVRGIPKQIQQPDYKAMKDSFTSKFWKLPAADTPSKGMMEIRLEMIEKQDFVAEPLSEVIDASQTLPDMMRSTFDNQGNFCAVRVGHRVPLPTNTEQFRQRIEVWGTSWIMASFIHTNRMYMVNLNPRLFDRYVKYLLGPNVLRLVSSGDLGDMVSPET